MSDRRLRLGTRGSRLALVQSRAVARALESTEPGLVVELVEVRTSGDRIKDVPLGPALGQSFFTKEIEDAVLDGRVDLAVHSCKDLATRLPDGLTLGAFPPREEPRDALVGAAPLADLPAGARVGTASVRRQRFLSLARPDLDVMDLRGNVPTRVAAVDEGRMDAVVLAAAGLRRLGLQDRIVELLDGSVMLPAAAQGALAVQIRADDESTAALVRTLDDAPTRAEVEAERACLRRLEAGCQAPVGVLARLEGAAAGTGAAAAEGALLRIAAAVVLDGAQTRVEVEGSAGSAEALGTTVAEDLLMRLGLESLRHAPWAGPPPRSSRP